MLRRKEWCLAVLLISVLVVVHQARADLSWLKEAKNCAGFSRGLRSFFVQTKDIASLTPAQRKEISTVLDEACTGRFAACNFAICKTVHRANRQQVAAANGQPMPEWLGKFLTCQEFTEEVKRRYGPRKTLSAEEKEELNRVLDVACSVRFGHCQFRHCPQAAAADNNELAQEEHELHDSLPGEEGRFRSAPEEEIDHEAQRRLRPGVSPAGQQEETADMGE